MFSVVIPLYNKERSVKNTIESVLTQTNQNFEIIVVNDGSTDKSVIEVLKIKSSKIKLITQKNQGVSAARNRGVLESKFDMIAFLDADDIWFPSHLEILSKVINKNPNHCFFATSFTKGEVPVSDIQGVSYGPIRDYYKSAIKSNLVWTSTVVINKKCFETCGGFNVLISRGEDLELWSRIADLYALIKINNTTAKYKIDAENRVSNNKYPIEKSFAGILSLKGLKGSKRRYFKYILFTRLKHILKEHQYKDAIKLIFKHNIELVL